MLRTYQSTLICNHFYFFKIEIKPDINPFMKYLQKLFVWILNNLDSILAMLYFIVSSHSLDKHSFKSWSSLEKFFIVPSFFPNNLFYIKSSSKRADRRRKTTDPSFRGIPHLFWPNNTGNWKSTGWRLRHLFWLQWPRVRGKRWVSLLCALKNT